MSADTVFYATFFAILIGGALVLIILACWADLVQVVREAKTWLSDEHVPCDGQPTGYHLCGREVHLPPTVPMDRSNFRASHAATVIPFSQQRRVTIPVTFDDQDVA